MVPPEIMYRDGYSDYMNGVAEPKSPTDENYTKGWNQAARDSSEIG